MLLDFSNIQNILILRIGKLGDLVTTSFVFEVIKNNNPNVKITLITKKSNCNLLKFNSKIDEIIYLDSGIKKVLQLLKNSFRRFDIIMDFNDNPSSTTKMIFRMFKAKYKCGYNFPSYSNYINVPVEQLNKLNSHIIERMSFFLKAIGLEVDESLVKPILYLNELEEKKSKSYFKNKKTIAVNLSAGAKIRYWKNSKWIELIKRINKKFNNFEIILLSTNKDRAIGKNIIKNIDPVRIILPEIKSVQMFAGFIKYSDVLITPDTSAVHIASAFNTPVIALFPYSEWNFASWQPFKTPHRSIHSDSESINTIEVDKVFNEFSSLIYETNIV